MSGYTLRREEPSIFINGTYNGNATTTRGNEQSTVPARLSLQRDDARVRGTFKVRDGSCGNLTGGVSG